MACIYYQRVRIDNVDATTAHRLKSMQKHRLNQSMLIDITTMQLLGLVIRATRKSQKIRMDDLAGSAGVGPVFVREVERGKETVQVGRVLKLLAELGVELKADVPDAAIPQLSALKTKGVKPLKRRMSAHSTQLQSSKPVGASASPATMPVLDIVSEDKG